jgi:polysaccharide biosynthesis/export protein
MNMRIFSIALAVCIAAASAQAQTPTTAPPSPVASSGAPTLSDGASSAYILGRDDVVDVSLLGRTDFGGRVRVQADGTIQLAFVGKIPAAERTSADLSDVIRKALQAGGYFADPVVVVEVVGYASRYVTVLGEIGAPSLVPINRPYRLSEILAKVGGVKGGAADYIIVRPEKGAEQRYLLRDLQAGDISQDPFVTAGDKIFAPAADLYYIYGQINSPGAFPLQNNPTVRMVIAKSGGLTQSGSDKKVTATRGGKQVKVKLTDQVLPGDVLFVGERLF